MYVCIVYVRHLVKQFKFIFAKCSRASRKCKYGQNGKGKYLTIGLYLFWLVCNFFKILFCSKNHF